MSKSERQASKSERKVTESHTVGRLEALLLLCEEAVLLWTKTRRCDAMQVSGGCGWGRAASERAGLACLGKADLRLCPRQDVQLRRSVSCARVGRLVVLVHAELLVVLGTLHLHRLRGWPVRKKLLQSHRRGAEQGGSGRRQRARAGPSTSNGAAVARQRARRERLRTDAVLKSSAPAFCSASRPGSSAHVKPEVLRWAMLVFRRGFFAGVLRH